MLAGADTLGFEMSEVFRDGVDFKTWRHHDFEFIRKRISTHRSLISRKLSMHDSRYYEGARTLIDVLEIFLKACPDFIPVTFSAKVHPKDAAVVHISGHTSPTDGSDPVVGCGMELTYTCRGLKLPTEGDTISNVSHGYFIVELRGAPCSDRWAAKKVTLGTVKLSEIVDGAEDINVVPANENGVLGYGENFPITSAFAKSLTDAWETVTKVNDIIQQEEM